MYVVFDIDGTLANTDERRLVYLRTEPKNWDAFHFGSITDYVNLNVYELYQAYHDQGTDIVILTARPETYREITEKWLRQNGIFYKKLLMRADRDYRKDGLVKLDEIRLLEAEYGIAPIIIFDDSENVIDTLTEHSYNVFDAKKLR